MDKIFRSIKQLGYHGRQGGGVCGIEMGLWDLAGKAYNVPVYQMLGGKFRDSIRCYADTTESHDPTVYGKRLRARRRWSEFAEDEMKAVGARWVPEEYAAVAPVIDAFTQPIFDEARKRGLRDSFEAYRSDAVLAAWEDALAVPAWDRAPVWLHGDPHPANILIRDGAVSAVIDFGDITAGDPASDLSLVWMLLPAACHDRFRAAYAETGDGPVSDATWARGRGWALNLAIVFLAWSADNPRLHEVGRRTLAAVLAG